MLLGIRVTVSFAFDRLGKLLNWSFAALLTFPEVSTAGVPGRCGRSTWGRNFSFLNKTNAQGEIKSPFLSGTCHNDPTLLTNHKSFSLAGMCIASDTFPATQIYLAKLCSRSKRQDQLIAVSWLGDLAPRAKQSNFRILLKFPKRSSVLVSTLRADCEDAHGERVRHGIRRLPRMAAAAGRDPGASAADKPLETRGSTVQHRNRKERGSREARALSRSPGLASSHLVASGRTRFCWVSVSSLLSGSDTFPGKQCCSCGLPRFW